MDRWRLDLRHVYRSLALDPLLVPGLVAVSFVGILLASALFVLADPFLFKPLPYRDPERLVIIRIAHRRDASPPMPTVVATLEDWKERRDLFDGVTAYGDVRQVVVRTSRGTFLARLVPVDRSFFEVLGRAQALNDFSSVSTERGRHVALETTLADVTVEDQHNERITLDGQPVNLAGLLPRIFVFPSHRTPKPEILEAAQLSPVVRVHGTSASWQASSLTVIARMRVGVTADVVAAALSASLAETGLVLTAEPIDGYMKGAHRKLAQGAFIAALLILAVCAANLGTLQIVRGHRRRREWALRTALGARANDLRRVIALEAVLMSLLSATLSLACLPLGMTLVRHVVPPEYLALGSQSLSPRTVMFALLVASALAGLSAIVRWSIQRAAVLPPLARTLSGAGRGLRWFRRAMIMSQCLAASILLVCGTLLARSYMKLWSEEPGFGGRVTVVSTSNRSPRTSPIARVQEIDETIAGLRTVPGVGRVGASIGSLLDNWTVFSGMFLALGDRQMLVSPTQVSTDYFAAIGATMTAGRAFLPTDQGGKALIVNEAFARSIWPGQATASIVGRTGTTMNKSIVQIVGVVGDMRDRTLDSTALPRVFTPVFDPPLFVPVHYAIRHRFDSVRLELPAVRAAIGRVNPDNAVFSEDELMARLAATVRARTFATVVATIFALAAVGTTAAGLISLVAFIVSTRTREIAIRIAVGADARAVLWFVAGDTILAAFAGILTGLTLGAAISRYLKSQLYGLAPGDPATIVLAALTLVSIVAIAVRFAAGKALTLSPTHALHVD